MNDNDDVFDEVSRFDDDFSPESNWRPGPDVLPDGLVDLEIIEARPDRTPEKREAILRLCLRTLSGPAAGTVLDHVYFLTSPESTARLGGDLLTLNFDADRWQAPQRPFSQELKKVLPRMKGLRFRAKKETNWSQTKQKHYHNLRINSLLEKGATLLPAGASSTPAAPAPRTTTPPMPVLAAPNGSSVPAYEEEGSEEIPF